MSVRGCWLTFGWSAAEAVWWPFTPEAVLVPLAAARPMYCWPLVLSATAGSVAGGALSYLIGRTGAAGSLLPKLPLVRAAMVAAAQRWIATEGALAVRHQPLSGVPFKVFALLAGQNRLALGSFLAWAAIGRGSRFVACSTLSAVVGHRFERQVREKSGLLLLLWFVLFTLGLFRSVGAWNRVR